MANQEHVDQLDITHLIRVCEAFGEHPGRSHEGCCTPETACDLICAELAQWDANRYKFVKTFDKPTIFSLLHRLVAAEKTVKLQQAALEVWKSGKANKPGVVL